MEEFRTKLQDSSTAKSEYSSIEDFVEKQNRLYKTFSKTQFIRGNPTHSPVTILMHLLMQYPPILFFYRPECFPMSDLIIEIYYTS